MLGFRRKKHLILIKSLDCNERTLSILIPVTSIGSLNYLIFFGIRVGGTAFTVVSILFVHVMFLMVSFLVILGIRLVLVMVMC